MKSIETEFNGVIFRSRTEARWAAFMWALDVQYNYEPEGYDLGEDGFYLPDFYLPKIKAFLEIKPIIPVAGRTSPTESLARLSGLKVHTFCGPPLDPSSMIDAPESGSVDFPSGGHDFSYWFCICPHCRRAGIEFNGRADRIPCKCQKSPHGDKGYNDRDPKLLSAYAFAESSFRWNPKK